MVYNEDWTSLVNERFSAPVGLVGLDSEGLAEGNPNEPAAMSCPLTWSSLHGTSLLGGP